MRMLPAGLTANVQALVAICEDEAIQDCWKLVFRITLVYGWVSELLGTKLSIAQSGKEY